MYTGNIYFAPLRNSSRTVYPCVYREHITVYKIVGRRGGLSLCIQGTWLNKSRQLILITVYPCVYREHDWKYHLFLFSIRFIPVHTGNIKWFWLTTRAPSVYPCAYREHVIFPARVIAPRGLSLCIQGTYSFIEWVVINYRFIPVHTGNIHRQHRCQFALPVYPCAYREHCVPVTNSISTPGLSLCIQGTYTERWVNCPGSRFIPVHTGNI